MRQATDKALFVNFEQRAIYNKAKSEGEKVLHNDGHVVAEIPAAGRPIFDDVDYVRIVSSSSKDSIPERPATCCDAELLKPGAKQHDKCRARRLEECDVHRFYEEWSRYKSGQEEQSSGTPIRTWPGVTRGQAEEMAHDRIHTVEALAGLNDSVAGRWLSHREKAREFLKAAEKLATVADIRAEREAQNATIRALQAQVEALVASQPKPQPVQKAK